MLMFRLKKHMGDFSIGALAVEVVAIIVAVVLGIFVTQWQENRADARLALEARASIVAEIRLNREQLAGKVQYYTNLTAAVDSVAATRGEAAFSGGEIPGWSGINPALLQEASFKASAATGALTHLAFTETRWISQAYLAQEMVAKAFDWTLQSVMTGQVRSWNDAQRVFHLLLESTQIAVMTCDAVLERLEGGVAEKK